MTGDLRLGYENLRRVSPNANVEDILEAATMKLEGKLPTVTDEQLALERQSLKRLEKALSIFEIGQALYDIDSGKSLSVALKRIEEQEKREPTLAFAMANPDYNYNATEEDTEEMLDNDALVNAIEEAIDNGDDDTLEDLLEKLKSRRKIRLGINRTKISDNRIGLNKHVRSFNSLVNAPQNAFNRLAQLRHEGVDDQEFEALCEDVMNEDDSDNIVSENTSFRIRQIMIQKAAEKRDRQNAEKKRTDFLRNRHANELANEGLTRAQASIEAHEFEPDEAPLSAFLPKEFAKIEPSTDNSFAAQAGRMKSSTKAVATIARSSNIKFKDNAANDKGNIAANQTARAAAAVASQMSGEETYKRQPNSQGQTKMDPRTLTQTLPPNGR